MAGAACATALPILFGIGVAAGVKSASGVILLVIVGLLLALVVLLVIRKRRKKTRTATVDTSRRDPDQDSELDLAS